MEHDSSAFVQFDPYEWENFFFGTLSRDEAIQMLTQAEVGSFLIRNSSKADSYSLSVKENVGENQIHHYCIDKIDIEGKTRYEMIDSNNRKIAFVNIPLLIDHYKTTKLRESCLVRPVERLAIYKVIGVHKFDGDRTTDLPFERGEIFEILDKPEESWWRARNSLGCTGLIPSNYVKIINDDELVSLNPSTSTNSICESSNRCSASAISTSSEVEKRSSKNKENREKNEVTEKYIPGWVRVIADRQPSIYDVEALSLKQGQLVYLIEILQNGMCRGLADENGKVGLFPFSYIEFTSIPPFKGPWTLRANLI